MKHLRRFMSSGLYKQQF